jgi:hypothetical protein
MIRTVQTSIDDRDLRAMTRGKGSLGRNLVLVTIPATLLFFGLVYIVWRSWLVAWIAAACVFAASAWSNLRFSREVRRRRESRAYPGTVQVTEVEASLVLDIEPLGSHGPAWVFFADDGKAMLLVGQWLLGYRTFPSMSFRLYQWSDTKEVIRIAPTGKRAKLEASTAQLRASYRPIHAEVFEATPETLQNDLDRAFSKQEFNQRS